MGTEIHTYWLFSREETLRRERLLPSVKCEKDECEVTINDLRNTEETHVFETWVLTFLRTGAEVKLEYVERTQNKLVRTKKLPRH